MLADMLELIHTVSRLKAIPSLRESSELPEAERVRGAALADRLSVPVLGRAWQMLLKGVGEVEAAPDRRNAAEMVLIRLCHVHDMPTPGDLVRRLSEMGPESGAGSGGAPASGGPRMGGAGIGGPSMGNPGTGGPGMGNPGGGGGMRASGSGGTVMTHAAAQPRPQMAMDPAPVSASAPSLRSWREVVAYVATCREAMLHGHLRHSVHLVRFAAPVIEIRPEPQAPRDLTQRLAAILSDATGTRWTIAVSSAPGEPTLSEQSDKVEARNRSNAEAHPLVQAILSAFPGARVGRLHDTRLDEYGLLPEPEPVAPDLDFSPLGAESVGLDDLVFDPNDLPEDD
jgi:DNA polymerase III subunit gamma/tau